MRHRLPIIGAGVVYVVALLLIGLWPSHVDRDLDLAHRVPTTWLVAIFDLTPDQGYRIGEFGANILLFLPLGALLLALLPRLGWLRVTALAGLFSIAIELTQTVARPGRTGSVADVVANTTGAALGAVLVALWLRRAGQRHR
ncbi:VanZ family protein [Aeromicrobium chenweiae]|uniref:VanZ family protein n=1 Tax=Aeromicrobium chenweiae TaxID=2079793 RepID=A0A2S0WHR3_9ACTN|nr:VanZ family protein [Aeromicrobium chenweiae]AWB90822.1 VanZ family protein [Aeromicrobium chenweiae]TGN31085.1 VanZ family protein [Aeromicrobium chenweiae]